MVVLDLSCCPWVFFSCGERGLRFSCDAWGSHCSGFSCGAQALGKWASVLAMCGLRSCDSQA